MSQLTPQEIARGCLLRIVAQPGRYDQGTWQTVNADAVDFGGGVGEVSCPTTGCVAGTAAMLAGDTSVLSMSELTTRFNRRVYMINQVVTANGRRVDIRERGRQLLGLSYEDHSWLFAGHRTLPEVVNALIELSEGRPLTRRIEEDMTPQEQEALRRYRVPSAVKRKSVPATPATPSARLAHQEVNRG